MATDVVTVDTEASFKDIVRLLDEHDVSALPVVDAGGKVIGIVSNADLLPKQAAQEPSDSHSFMARFKRHRDDERAEPTTAGKLMSHPVHTIGPDDTVVDAAKVLDKHGVKRLPVVAEDGTLLGIVSRRDLLTVFLRGDDDIAADIAEYIFARNLDTVVDPATVTIEVRDGVVTLRGEIERKSMIPIAETLTSRVDGVVAVRNRLTFARDDGHIQIPEAMTVNITQEPPLKR
ncbi:MAG: CBS domain-containing protein [Labedaea sp.]